MPQTGSGLCLGSTLAVPPPRAACPSVLRWAGPLAPRLVFSGSCGPLPGARRLWAVSGPGPLSPHQVRPGQTLDHRRGLCRQIRRARYVRDRPRRGRPRGQRVLPLGLLVHLRCPECSEKQSGQLEVVRERRGLAIAEVRSAQEKWRRENPDAETDPEVYPARSSRGWLLCRSERSSP